MKKFLYLCTILSIFTCLSGMEPDDGPRSLVTNRPHFREVISHDNSASYLDQLNVLANGLIAQVELLRELEHYAPALKEFIEVRERSDKDPLSGPNGMALPITSPEALSIILKHSRIFSGLLYRNQEKLEDVKEKVEAATEEWQHISELDELSARWQHSDNEEICALGRVIGLVRDNFKQRNVKLRAEDSLFKYLNKIIKPAGEFYFINCYIETEKNAFVNANFYYLKKIKELVIKFVELRLNAKKGNVPFPHAVEMLFTNKFYRFLEEYKKHEAYYLELYKNIVEEINAVIEAQERAKKGGLYRYRNRAKSYLSFKSTPIKTFDGKSGALFETLIAYEGSLLPGQLPLLYPFVDVESQDDSFIPKKKSAQPRPKKPAKPKAKKNSQQPISKQSVFKVLESQKDGSRVIAETEDYILVDDPKNKLVSKIFKSDDMNKVSLSQRKLKGIQMTDWVNAWYENPQQALKDQGYLMFGSRKFAASEEYPKVIALHSPAYAIWQYLVRHWAKQSETPSRREVGKQDILLTVPGINEYTDGQKEMGVFSYIIDSQTNELYHANFQSRTGKQLMDDYLQKGYFQVEFPSLDEVYKN